MTGDHLATKTLAVLLAFGGLVVLMIQDRPNWNATCLAILCLIGFCGLWILSRRPAVRPAPVRRIRVEILPPDGPDAHRPRLLEGHPGALDLLPFGRARRVSGPPSRLSAPRHQLGHGQRGLER